MISKLILTTGAVGSASIFIYLIQLYHSLSRKVEHSQFVGQLPAHASPSPSDSISTDSAILDQLQTVQSLPSSFQSEPQKYYAFYDTCSKTIPTSSLNKAFTISDLGGLLTRLLRRNMSLFATRLPQAWLFKILISRKMPALLPSFEPEHIRTLDFNPGDVVAGMYRVVVRTPTKVEFDIWLPPGSGIDLPPIEGRLIFKVDLGNLNYGSDEEAKEIILTTQTLQWKLQEQNDIILPLERTVFKRLHELASWWLLESGVVWLGEAGEVKNIRDKS